MKKIHAQLSDHCCVHPHNFCYHPHNFSSLLRRASQISRSQIGINYEKLLVTRGGMLHPAHGKHGGSAILLASPLIMHRINVPFNNINDFITLQR